MNNNCIILQGTLREELVYNHSYDNEKFYRGTIMVQRLSGTLDNVPIVVSEKLLPVIKKLAAGDIIDVVGEIRTRNYTLDGKRHNDVFVFAKYITMIDQECVNSNEVYLTGYICKKSDARKTPFSRDIIDLCLAVNRRSKKSDYIPLIVWGRNATYCDNLDIGTKITVKGRLQSREYTKVIDKETLTLTAYEVSVSSMEVTKDDIER